MAANRWLFAYLENGPSGGYVFRNCFALKPGQEVQIVCVTYSRNGPKPDYARCNPFAAKPLRFAYSQNGPKAHYALQLVCTSSRPGIANCLQQALVKKKTNFFCNRPPAWPGCKSFATSPCQEKISLFF
jgi:hypothetical protein